MMPNVIPAMIPNIIFSPNLSPSFFFRSAVGSVDALEHRAFQ